MTLKSFLHHLNRRDTRLFPHLNPLSKFILIFAIITGSIFLTKNIFAQNTQNKGSGNMEYAIDTTGFMEELIKKQAAAQKPHNLESWNLNTKIDGLVFFNTAMAGDITKDVASGNWVPGGLIGLTNNSIATLYQPPISGVQYIAHTIDNFMGIPTYAANGFGFDTLSGSNTTNGIMSLWKTMRNAVYSLFSLFFIILGIMIMLRVKISPQATISIQVILPKIIISLVLVTFSYAIVGLLIDFSYVFQGLILSLILKSEGISPISTMLGTYDVPELMNLNWYGIRDITSDFFTPVTNTVLGGIGALIGFILGVFTGGWSMLIMPLAGGVLGLVFVNGFILWQVLKLFFGLAKCYINILLKIITAPLEIGLGVFPGSKINFSSWIVELIANLVVFPATVIFLVIIVIFVRAIGGGGTNYFWTPNILATGDIMGFVIGITGIMLLGKIPQIVPEFLFNIKPSPFSKMIGDTYKGYAKSGAVTGAVSYAKAKGMQYGGGAVEWMGGKLIKDATNRGSKFGVKLGQRIQSYGSLNEEVGQAATGYKKGIVDKRSDYIRRKAENRIK